jgi:hypothetical protein
LQLDRNVLHDVTQPRTFIFAHTAHKATGLAIRTAVFMQARKSLEQRAYKVFAQTACRPLFEHTEVEYVTDNREASEDARPDKYIGTFNFHD